MRVISASIVEEGDNQYQYDNKNHEFDDQSQSIIEYEAEMGECDEKIVYEVESQDLHRAILALKMKSTL